MANFLYRLGHSVSVYFFAFHSKSTLGCNLRTNVNAVCLLIQWINF
ncbi:unnamed protein product [Amoebophrya sp. A25]|nr:unnamed protein product [Amoebophrya sp. A25]|eukprot:GSA25T00013636001.1